MRVLLTIAGLAFLLTGCGCEQIDTGHRGIRTHFGEVVGEPLPEGLIWYNPFTESIRELNVQEQKWENETSCYTKDTQNVTVKYALTYYPDPSKIGAMYKQFGKEWDQKLVSPASIGALKDVIGQYIADDLVSKRDAARTAAFNEIKETLAERGVLVTRLDLVNLDFDDAYEKAVEDKVVAVQKAAEAKNKTVEVEEQARQKVISAEAEAKSMTIRSQALQQNKGLVEYEAVQRWDGKLPVQMLGNTVPFLNVQQAARQ